MSRSALGIFIKAKHTGHAMRTSSLPIKKYDRKGPGRGIGLEPKLSSHCRKEIHSSCFMLRCNCECHAI